jgi:hypothetical protein
VPREYLGHVLKLRRYSGLRKTIDKIGRGNHGFRTAKVKFGSLD